MQQHEQIQFIQEIGKFCLEQIAAATKPLHDRIANLERALGDMPVPKDGKDGEPGPPGKDGENGRDGIDGKSVSLDDVADLIQRRIAESIAALPVPAHIVSGFIDRRGNLFHVFSDGTQLDFGKVVADPVDVDDLRDWVKDELAHWKKPQDGKDGRDGIDGKDGLGFDDIQVSCDGERTLTIAFIKGDQKKEFEIYLHNLLHKGIWHEGQYQRSDCVTYEGSTWLAVADTQAQPGTKDSGWQLIVKKGHNGKDGKPGPEGPPGKSGRDGRDLTQMGFDGRKY